MITLYKQLNEIGLRNKFYFAYALALIIGSISISFLLYSGGYLQIFIIVILLGMLVHPYVYLRMRLPLYNDLAAAKKDKDVCPNELKEYIYFSKLVWKNSFSVVRKISKTTIMIYINLIFYIFIFFYLESHECYNIYNNIFMVLAIISIAFSIFIYLSIAIIFNRFCNKCERGDVLED